MTDRTCASCPNPVHNQDTLCNACTRKTRRHLANQAAYLADLETELARMSHKQPPSEGGRSAEIPLPYSPIAGDLISEQRNLLTSWVRLCVDEHILAEWPADTVPSLASWLIVALPVLRKHERAGEFRAQVRKLSEDIIRCIDAAPYRSRFPAGPCFKEYDDGHGVMEVCPGTVTAYVPADEGPSWLECGECQAQWNSTQWMRAGDKMDRRKEQIRRQRELAASFTRQRVA